MARAFASASLRSTGARPAFSSLDRVRLGPKRRFADRLPNDAQEIRVAGSIRSAALLPAMSDRLRLKDQRELIVLMIVRSTERIIWFWRL